MIPIRGLRAPVDEARRSGLPQRFTYVHRPHSLWSSDSEQKLSELWSAGLPVNDIAKRIGVTRNAIMGKAFRLGLPRRPSPIRRAAE
jgi:hypothetical protein